MTAPRGDPCVIVVFGAAGDMMRRLLVPALYNLACDGLLSSRLAIVGVAREATATAGFRERLNTEIRRYTTRKDFDDRVWADLVGRLHYVAGSFEEETTYGAVADLLETLSTQHQTGGNALFYLATPPAVFGLIGGRLAAAGLNVHPQGWRRLIVEKPFGRDLASAIDLNRALLARWQEEQLFRIDHYLGKETVQNLLSFRFSNGIFEPLWTRHHIDHIQFTVAESVGVEGRGRYYDSAGVLRDMIQNHMFQMLAYLCMEPPSSLRADAVRNEKAKVLEAVRIMRPEDVLRDTVRGQYGPGRKPDGTPVPGYRQEEHVAPDSVTETFAALRLQIDNWRWEGVPIYLRSGKSLWKRGTEILVQFKKAPEVLFRAAGVGSLEHNQLIFHIQPDQGIELRFQAKHPGPQLALQKVDMRFDYQDAFEAARSTGYEVLLYHCMRGDATLFTRNDLVEAAWRIAQPILDTWAANPPRDFPNYEAGTWGPKAAFDLVERDGRKWLEVINRAVLEKVPLFAGCSAVFLHGLALVLKPAVYAEGDTIVKKGDAGSEMYFVARGEVEIVDGDRVVSTLGEGSFFGEKSLLLAEPRSASARALTQCDLYVLEKPEFMKVLRDHPGFARSILDAYHRRYQLALDGAQAFDSYLAGYLDRET
ncbi:MAG TPA: glucose-6-phosphate dehydrogenase [Burkholderiales bacterium]|nr:glucose-6-phosphate dehydrogenase [Burkholderiales bacterium]